MRKIARLIAPLLVIACTKEELLQKFSTPEAQQTARAYIDQLRAHDFDPIEQALDPSLHSADLHQTLERMAALIPNEKERSVKLVGAQIYQTPDAVTLNTSFEYSFQDKWILANVARYTLTRARPPARARRPATAPRAARIRPRSARSLRPPPRPSARAVPPKNARRRSWSRRGRNGSR
jgi:hypothetical protein